MILSERLNLKLSWMRVKNDLKYECFVNHPYKVNIIESNLSIWLNTLKDNIEDYEPTISPTIDIPKKNWHIRPVNVLKIERSCCLLCISFRYYRKNKKFIVLVLKY